MTITASEAYVSTHDTIVVAAETETYEDAVDSTTRHSLTLRDISGTGPATVALSSGEGSEGPARRIPGELEGTSPRSPSTLPERPGERPGGHPARPETDPRRSRLSTRGPLSGRDPKTTPGGAGPEPLARATTKEHFSKSLVGPEHPFGGPVKHWLLDTRFAMSLMGPFGLVATAD